MIVPFGFLKQPSGFAILYNDISVMYSLRRPGMSTLWTNAVLKVRRDSDNQTAFVFFENHSSPSINDTITLNSLISTSSNTTPSATLFSAWMGSGTGFVEEWIGITPNNIINNNKIASQTVNLNQPRIANVTGDIFIKNGRAYIHFGFGLLSWLDAPVNTDLGSTNDYTIFTVSFAANPASNQQGVLTTSDSSTERFDISNDRRSNKRIVAITDGTFSLNLELLVQQDTDNQRLQTVVV